MKARWTAEDLDRMHFARLPFTEDDVALIRRSLPARSSGGTTLTSVVPPVEILEASTR